MYLMMQIGW